MECPDISVLSFYDQARGELKNKGLLLLELMQNILSIVQNLPIAKDSFILFSIKQKDIICIRKTRSLPIKSPRPFTKRVNNRVPRKEPRDAPDIVSVREELQSFAGTNCL